MPAVPESLRNGVPVRPQAVSPLRVRKGTPQQECRTSVQPKHAHSAAGSGGAYFLSTFDTDYVLVPGERLEEATTALRLAGHVVD